MVKGRSKQENNVVTDTEYARIEKKRCLIKVFSQISIVLLLGRIYLIIVRKIGKGIPCIFYKLTGLQCPGCGMTRAMVEIWKGHFRAAFHYNALSLTVFPVLCIYMLFRLIHTEMNKVKEFYIWEYVVLIVLFLITIGYAYVRNTTI